MILRPYRFERREEHNGEHDTASSEDLQRCQVFHGERKRYLEANVERWRGTEGVLRHRSRQLHHL